MVEGNKSSVMLGVSHPHPISRTPLPRSLGKKGEGFREGFPQIGKSRVVQRDLELLGSSGTGGVVWECGDS